MATNISFEDDELQVVLIGCDTALRTQGLNLYSVVSRVLAKLPKVEPKKEVKDEL
jgi:hypothetical protein